MEQVIPGARSARGVAVALLTAPGVVGAHALTTGRAPSLLPIAVVCTVVVLVACLVPTRGAGSTAAVAALAQLAGHTVLALAALAAPATAPRGGCLSVVGTGAEAGVRYALADTSGSCPPGALPATPGLTAAAAAVAAAVDVLLGHALLAVLTAAIVVAAATGLAVATRLVDAVRPILLVLLLAGLPRTGDVRPLPTPAPAPLAALWRPGVHLLRGPPVLRTA